MAQLWPNLFEKSRVSATRRKTARKAPVTIRTLKYVSSQGEAAVGSVEVEGGFEVSGDDQGRGLGEAGQVEQVEGDAGHILRLAAVEIQAEFHDPLAVFDIDAFAAFVIAAARLRIERDPGAGGVVCTRLPHSPAKSSVPAMRRSSALNRSASSHWGLWAAFSNQMRSLRGAFGRPP